MLASFDAVDNSWHRSEWRFYNPNIFQVSTGALHFAGETTHKCNKTIEESIHSVSADVPEEVRLTVAENNSRDNVRAAAIVQSAANETRTADRVASDTCGAPWRPLGNDKHPGVEREPSRVYAYCDVHTKYTSLGECTSLHENPTALAREGLA